MEVTKYEANNIKEVVIGMFDLALDYTVYSDLLSYYNAVGDSLLELGAALSQTEAFLYRTNSLNLADKTTYLMSNFDLKTGTIAGDVARNYFDTRLSAGETLDQLAVEAVIYLDNDAIRDPVFDVTKITMDNKASVSQFLMDSGIFVTNINELDVLKDVTDSFSSVAVAEKNIEQGDKWINYVKYSNTNNGLDSLSSFDTYGVKEIDSGHRWGDDIREITYSFNNTLPDEYSAKDSQNWQELNNNQKYAVREIMDNLSNFLDVHFTETPNDSGMLRFNVVDMQDNIAGYAYYPEKNSEIAGDIFLSQAFNTDEQYEDLKLGGLARHAIAHEIGHTLGLKHPFEGTSVLPSELDDSNHTVMSYTNTNNLIPIYTKDLNQAHVNTEYIYPQSYALYDIDTLQAIYGVNTNTNTTNDIYTSKYADYKISTIWDAGGVDTIDLSDNKGQDIIDMRGNTINSADKYSLDNIVKLKQDEINDDYYNDWIREYITDLYEEDRLYTGKNNLSIAKGVVIENINTGSNSDFVVDNEVDNHISTSLGDDNIYLGNGGFDTVFGGEGFDTVHLNMQKEDLKVDMLGNDDYIIKGDDFAAEIIGVEYIYFDPIASGYLPSELVA